jgi:hypothetical protein
MNEAETGGSVLRASNGWSEELSVGLTRILHHVMVRGKGGYGFSPLVRVLVEMRAIDAAKSGIRRHRG